jgi:hypothetical protein
MVKFFPKLKKIYAGKTYENDKGYDLGIYLEATYKRERPNKRRDAFLIFPQKAVISAG